MLLLMDIWPGRCGKRGSVFQAKPVGVGRLWTRRAPARAFPVDPEGERSSFREAESFSLSMPVHRPRGGSRPEFERSQLTYSPRRNIPAMRFSRNR